MSCYPPILVLPRYHIRKKTFQQIWHSSQTTNTAIFSYFIYIPYKLYKATAFLAEG